MVLSLYFRSILIYTVIDFSILETVIFIVITTCVKGRVPIIIHVVFLFYRESKVLKAAKEKPVRR